MTTWSRLPIGRKSLRSVPRFQRGKLDPDFGETHDAPLSIPREHRDEEGSVDEFMYVYIYTYVYIYLYIHTHATISRALVVLQDTRFTAMHITTPFLSQTATALMARLPIHFEGKPARESKEREPDPRWGWTRSLEQVYYLCFTRSGAQYVHLVARMQLGKR